MEICVLLLKKEFCKCSFIIGKHEYDFVRAPLYILYQLLGIMICKGILGRVYYWELHTNFINFMDTEYHFHFTITIIHRVTRT